MKKEPLPFRCQVPDRDKIACKDCIHRDKTIIVIDGKEICVGVTKGECAMYVHPDTKPSEVLFQNADCDFYEKE